MAIVFLLKTAVLKKIKENSRYHEPPDNKYVAIPYICAVNLTCYFIVVICMFSGFFLFDIMYAKPADSALWFIMMISAASSGLYYGLMIHKKYFYFTFGEDYIEFYMKIGNHSEDAINIPTEEIESIKKDAKGYCIVLKDQSRYTINTKNIEGLSGSELLKKKLENFND